MNFLSGKSNLTFNDGLNFGCGFFVAGLVFFACALPLGIGILVIVLQFLGVAIGELDRII